MKLKIVLLKFSVSETYLFSLNKCNSIKLRNKHLYKVCLTRNDALASLLLSVWPWCCVSVKSSFRILSEHLPIQLCVCTWQLVHSVLPHLVLFFLHDNVFKRFEK